MPLMIFLLSGCIDLGRVGIHPELKTIYFKSHTNAVANCLYSAALKQELLLIKDDPLPGNTSRFNLQDEHYDNVAYVDISPSGENQSSVDFFYAPHAPDVHNAIVSMIAQCERELR